MTNPTESNPFLCSLLLLAYLSLAWACTILCLSDVSNGPNPSKPEPWRSIPGLLQSDPSLLTQKQGTSYFASQSEFGLQYHRTLQALRQITYCSFVTPKNICKLQRTLTVRELEAQLLGQISVPSQNPNPARLYPPNPNRGIPATQQLSNSGSFPSQLLRRSMPGALSADRPNWMTQSLPSGEFLVAAGLSRVILKYARCTWRL